MLCRFARVHFLALVSLVSVAFLFCGSASAETTVTVTSDPATGTVGSPTTFTAHVLTDGVPETGSAAFFINGYGDALRTLVDGEITYTTTPTSKSGFSVQAKAVVAGALYSSTIFVYEINGVATTTTIDAPPADVDFGSVPSFTAHVTTGSQPLTGRVEFWDGLELFANVLVDGTGTAVVTPAYNVGNVGEHHIYAKYSGDSKHEVSSSATVPMTVHPLATTTLLTQDRAQSPSMESFSLTASVTTVTGSPVFAGDVEFYDNGLLFATQSFALGPNVVVTDKTLLLGVGTHVITAKFTGQPSMLASTSAAVVHVVTPAPLVILPPPGPTLGQVTANSARVSSTCLAKVTSPLTASIRTTAAARVTFRLERRTAPKTVPASCPKPFRLTGTKFVKVTSSTLNVTKDGTQSTTLAKILGRTKLVPGTYRITMTAVRSDGQSARPMTTGFVVLAAKKKARR